MRSLRWALVIAALFAGCSSDRDPAATSTSASTASSTTSDATTSEAPSVPEVLEITIVDEHPHDPEAFTQGFVFVGDRLFESTGGYGASDVREVDPETGSVVKAVPLPIDEFGEGLAADGERLRQITWKEGTARAWSLDLEAGDVASYEGEGWGLAFDAAADRWIQSDGTGTLTFRDPDTFAATGTLRVRRPGGAVSRLNELEVVGGSVWANVWHSDDILRIDLDSGVVTATADAGELVPDGVVDPESVLNGIAHRPGDPANRLWLTGKRWPTTYVVDIG